MAWRRKSAHELVLLTSILVKLSYPLEVEQQESYWECQLPVGQYICDRLEIDNITQSIKDCQRGLVSVPCRPLKGSLWHDTCPKASKFRASGKEIAFYQTVPCRWTNGYSFALTLSFSVFLGFLGLDRFYLGYPTLGLLKFFTCGLGGLWWLVDIILVAFQIVGPFDGSDYVMDYFGPIMQSSGYEL